MPAPLNVGRAWELMVQSLVPVMSRASRWPIASRGLSSLPHPSGMMVDGAERRRDDERREINPL